MGGALNGSNVACGVAIAPARDGDLAAITALLEELALPTQGIADQFPSAYVVAFQSGRKIGCAGLETYARVGLLRSVAVSPAARGLGVGRALVAERVAAARAKRLDAVYLLTTTAADYFTRLGFTAFDRREAPEALLGSPEFATICPASARGFVLRLS